jgi:hypothetical protein
MTSRATNVPDYLKELPPEREVIASAVVQLIRRHLQPGFEEGMQYGMISWFVPHRLYPAGYHVDPKQPLTLAGLASQKNHLSLYLPYLEPPVMRHLLRREGELDLEPGP